jgi:alkyl hydroperoxide reductase subunit D
MQLEQLKNQLNDSAKDIKLNLSMILTSEGAPDLSEEQIKLIALASAYATRIPTVTVALSEGVSHEGQAAAQAAATIMAMNNVYYRFAHLIHNKSYATMPAKLRMNIIANPGIDKVSFELMSLAVSAINGCGMCMDAHEKTLIKSGITAIGVQSTIRIAAVINALAQAVSVSL